jgi:plasmid replication initiation protein
MEKPQNLVKVSNALNRASYTLSLPEKRLLMLAITHLGNETKDSMIHISANEYADFFSLNRDGAYRTLKNASENLWSRTLVTEDGTKYRWIITSKYNEGGIVELEFHPKLKPHLLQIKNNFTQYLLHRASDFKLMYTWRLFELLMQFRSTGLLVISLDDFKKCLDVPSAYDRDFGLIRSKVIKPSIAEMLEKDGLNVEWKPLKTGRKVTGLEFRFPAEKQATLPFSGEVEVVNKIYTRTDLEKDSSLARPGESYEQALYRLNRH